MEGAIFYWIFWMFWVYLTFLINKRNRYRFSLAAIVLIVMIVSNSYISYGNNYLYFGGLLLLLFSYIFLGLEKSGAVLYHFICSLIISMAYVTFLLFEIFDPVWVIFNREWMMAIVIGCLAMLLQNNIKGRALIVVSGTMQGEFLYAYFLSKYEFPYSIGSFAYLDACSLILGLLVGWRLLENIFGVLQQHFNFFEKTRRL